MKHTLGIFVFLLVLLGCSTPATVVSSHKAAQVSLDQYVKDVDEQIVEVLNAYEKAVQADADYRHSVILRSLQGKDAATDVKIATEAYAERDRLYREAADEKAKILLNLGKLKINLYDHDKLETKIGEWLSTSGLSTDSAAELAGLIATEYAKRK